MKGWGSYERVNQGLTSLEVRAGWRLWGNDGVWCPLPVSLCFSLRYLEGNQLTAVPRELSALRHLTLM